LPHPSSEARLLELTRLEDLEAVQIYRGSFADLHHTGDVTAPVTVVGRGPDSDEVVVRREHELVALLDELVCTGNERKRVYVVELRRGRSAEWLVVIGRMGGEGRRENALRS
jgi:hypothetical protein